MALETVIQQPSDVIFLDVMLPGMDGFTLCKRLREWTTVPPLVLRSLPQPTRTPTPHPTTRCALWTWGLRSNGTENALKRERVAMRMVTLVGG
jgi:hypothetical protein